jgi:hypothetical protein
VQEGVLIMKCPVCNGVRTIFNKETGYLEFCECVPEEWLDIDMNGVDEKDEETAKEGEKLVARDLR